MQLEPQPAGFGRCAECAYRETGTPQICFLCASQEMEAIADGSCNICCLQLKSDGTCGNPLCSWDDRYFDRNHAIAMRSGHLEAAINRYKYENFKGWSAIFGRVLVGYLNAHHNTFNTFDVIIASPTFVSVEGTARRWDHT